MKKVILKSASITLAAIIAVALIVYGVFAFFFPSNLASFYRGASNYDMALKYSERVYKSSGKVGDLLVVVDDAIDSKNEQKIRVYAEKIWLYGELDKSERLRISESYCLALYNADRRIDALRVACDAVGEKYGLGYIEGNPLRALLGVCVSECNALYSAEQRVPAEKIKFLTQLQEKMNELALEELPDAQTALLKSDVAMLDEFISRVEK